MTMEQLSQSYRDSADKLRVRIWNLRRAVLRTDDPGEIWHLKQRIRQLTPLLTEMNELADLTAHYYDRGYWRDEKYIV